MIYSLTNPWCPVDSLSIYYRITFNSLIFFSYSHLSRDSPSVHFEICIDILRLDSLLTHNKLTFTSLWTQFYFLSRFLITLTTHLWLTFDSPSNHFLPFGTYSVNLYILDKNTTHCYVCPLIIMIRYTYFQINLSLLSIQSFLILDTLLTHFQLALDSPLTQYYFFYIFSSHSWLTHDSLRLKSWLTLWLRLMNCSITLNLVLICTNHTHFRHSFVVKSHSELNSTFCLVFSSYSWLTNNWFWIHVWSTYNSLLIHCPLTFDHYILIKPIFFISSFLVFYSRRTLCLYTTYFGLTFCKFRTNC